MSNPWPVDEPRFLINSTKPFLHEPESRRQLITTIDDIIRGCPPAKPWKDGFKDKGQGLWTGPTSIAYLFLWLSRTHPDLRFQDKLPMEWCSKYLACGSEDIKSPVGLNGWGIKNEYLAYNAVKASATGDMTFAKVLADAVTNDYKCPKKFNEHLSGRAGALALLRIVKHFVPESAELMDQCMKPLIEAIIKQIPWTFSGHHYIGAAHGDIGIITQVVLCDPTYGQSLLIQEQLLGLLDCQTPEGHWFITEDPNLGSPDLVHYCHGSPGFIISLIKIRTFFPAAITQRIDTAIQLGQKIIWEKGLLRKEPNLCHGITGNMMAFTGDKEREHFMAHATFEKVQEGIRKGTFVKGDDPYGLLWGEAGRAWGWMMLDKGVHLGFPGYTDV